MQRSSRRKQADGSESEMVEDLDSMLLGRSGGGGGWAREDDGLGGGRPTPADYTHETDAHTKKEEEERREKAECGGELALGEIKRLIDGGIMSKGGGGLCRGRPFPT